MCISFLRNILFFQNFSQNLGFILDLPCCLIITYCCRMSVEPSIKSQTYHWGVLYIQKIYLLFLPISFLFCKAGIRIPHLVEMRSIGKALRTKHGMWWLLIKSFMLISKLIGYFQLFKWWLLTCMLFIDFFSSLNVVLSIFHFLFFTSREGPSERKGEM